VLDQCLIMSRPGVVPSLFEEANGGRKTNRPCHVGSSCLELLRAMLEFSAVELDSVSHIAADVVRRHRIQQLATSPEDACRHWPEHLVPREDVKVTSQIPNVDLHVWHALRTVHDDARSGRVRLRANLFDRIDSAEHVGDVRQRDDPRPCRKRFLDGLWLEPPFVRHVDDANSGAALACKPCPGHQVRRMFRDRDDDLVAASQVRGSPRRRHQVDAFSRAANEHDLGRIGGVDETGDRLARSHQVIRGTTGQCVHARRIGVVRRVVLHERVDDRLWPECRRRTVQVRQRTPMDGLSKCREHRRPRCARIAPLGAG
jgi:hypothetical protein